MSSSRHLKSDTEVLEHPEKSNGAGEDLEQKSDEEPLRELGLFSLDKRRQGTERRPHHSLQPPGRKLVTQVLASSPR